MRTILASQSKARKQLMKKLNLPFTCHTSNYQEDMNAYKSPSRLVKFLALQKALFIAKKFPKSIIIGADTFGTLQGEIMGKPNGLAHAQSMLRKSSGKTMNVYTGVAVVQTDSRGNVTRALCEYEKASVTFKTLTTKDIKQIIQKDPVLETAGALSIEGEAGKFIQKISGDYDSIIGLPIGRLKKMLRQIEKTSRPV